MVFHWSLSDSKSPGIFSVFWPFSIMLSFGWSPFGRQLLLLLLLLEFFTSANADGLSLEFEWQQVSRTLLSILAVLNNVVVWMVSTHPPTSKSSSLFNNPLVTVLNGTITIGIIVTFMFYSFFNSLPSWGTYPSFHFLSVLFCGYHPQTCRYRLQGWRNPKESKQQLSFREQRGHASYCGVRTGWRCVKMPAPCFGEGWLRNDLVSY